VVTPHPSASEPHDDFGALETETLDGDVGDDLLGEELDDDVLVVDPELAEEEVLAEDPALVDALPGDVDLDLDDLADDAELEDADLDEDAELDGDEDLEDDDDEDEDADEDEDLDEEDLDEAEEQDDPDFVAASLSTAGAGDADDDTLVLDAAFDDEEDDLVAVVAGDDDEEVDGIRDGEFVCRACFLAKRETQLADAERMLCRDCA
jgi:hypothetical protein